MFLLATIGASALYLLFIWLLSASAAAWIAERKGYGERLGLFFGLILSAIGFVIVLFLPARAGSRWKVEGALPNPGARRPLGLATLGPSSGAEDAEALGPSLGDIPADGGAPQAAAPEPPQATEPESPESTAPESTAPHPPQPPEGGDPPAAGAS